MIDDCDYLLFSEVGGRGSRQSELAIQNQGPVNERYYSDNLNTKFFISLPFTISYRA